MSKAAIVMGSISDFDAVKPAVKILKEFGVECEVRVISAHRTPEDAHEFAAGAVGRGVDVIIAAAGKAAHLGGVVAAFTTLPVIGLPIKSSTMDGLDSLLSMVQMPAGIPVACVAIGGGLNAGLLAAQIIALKDGAVAEKFAEYKKNMAVKVNADDVKLQEMLKTEF